MLLELRQQLDAMHHTDQIRKLRATVDLAVAYTIQKRPAYGFGTQLRPTFATANGVLPRSASNLTPTASIPPRVASYFESQMLPDPTSSLATSTSSTTGPVANSTMFLSSHSGGSGGGGAGGGSSGSKSGGGGGGGCGGGGGWGSGGGGGAGASWDASSGAGGGSSGRGGTILDNGDGIGHAVSSTCTGNASRGSSSQAQAAPQLTTWLKHASTTSQKVTAKAATKKVAKLAEWASCSMGCKQAKVHSTNFDPCVKCRYTPTDQPKDFDQTYIRKTVRMLEATSTLTTALSSTQLAKYSDAQMRLCLNLKGSKNGGSARRETGSQSAKSSAELLPCRPGGKEMSVPVAGLHTTTRQLLLLLLPSGSALSALLRV